MYEEKFMIMALQLANQAYGINEVPVGAVLVDKDTVIGYGHNQVIATNSVTAHAEIIAINQASKYINNYRLLNTSLYCTLEPCHMCAKAIVDARIDHLFFGAYEPKTGAIESIDHFLNKDHLNHRTLYSGGHMHEQSSNLLKKFFRSRRARQSS